MDAYRRADDEYRVPWPILAAMGQVLTDHGARSPYDTLQRSDEQRFPVVDPAIAPGTDLGQGGTGTGTGTAGCRLRLVGDSLLDGIAQPVTQALAASCAIAGLDAREGRTIAEGTGRLDADPPTDETAVVVVLGTNDLAHGATRAELDRPHRRPARRHRRPPHRVGDLRRHGARHRRRHPHRRAHRRPGPPRPPARRRLGRLPRRAPRGRRRGLPGRRRRPLHARGLPGHGRLAGPPARRPPGPGRRRPGRRRWARPAAAQPHGVHRALGPGRPGRAALGRPPGRPDGPRRRADPDPGRGRRPRLPLRRGVPPGIRGVLARGGGRRARRGGRLGVPATRPEHAGPPDHRGRVALRDAAHTTDPVDPRRHGRRRRRPGPPAGRGPRRGGHLVGPGRGALRRGRPLRRRVPAPGPGPRHPVRPRAEHPHRRPAGPRPGEPPPRPAAGRHRVGAGRRGLGHHGAGPR